MPTTTPLSPAATTFDPNTMIAAKKSWRGCGNHIPAALAGVPEDQWCSCEPRVMIDGKSYPSAAKFEIPGSAWLKNLVGGGGGAGPKDGGKDDL